MGFHLCVYHHISLNLSVTLKQASVVYSVAILPAFIALNDCSEEGVPLKYLEANAHSLSGDRGG